MNKPEPSARNQFAWRLVKRYLVSKRGNTVMAMEKIRKTLAFPKEIDIDNLITAFDDKVDLLRASERKILSSKKFVVQGYDKKGA
jgi:hypothetical protein